MMSSNVWNNFWKNLNSAKPGEWPWLAALGYRSKQVPMLLRKNCLSFYQISEIIPLCLEGWASEILVWRGSYWAKPCHHCGPLYKIRPYNYPSGGECSYFTSKPTDQTLRQSFLVMIVFMFWIENQQGLCLRECQYFVCNPIHCLIQEHTLGIDTDGANPQEVSSLSRWIQHY